MQVNPILIVAGVFMLGTCVFFYIIRRPTKPYLSGVCLILLALFIGCTAVIDASLPPAPQWAWVSEQLRYLTPFVVFQAQPSVDDCEKAFRIYQIIDVVLFAATVASIAYDVWNSLIRSSRPSENDV